MLPQLLLYIFDMGVLGVTAKLVPCNSTDSCATDRMLLDKFTIQCLTFETWSWFEWPPVPLCYYWYCHHIVFCTIDFQVYFSGVLLALYAWPF